MDQKQDMNIGIKTSQSKTELNLTDRLTELLLHSPIPSDQLLSNLGLFINSKNLSRLLFFNDIYQQIIETQGIIIEFGVRWGPNLAVLSALRGIYEPFNRHRKIIGFDTFEGFLNVDKQDKSDTKDSIMFKHSLAVTYEYEKYLEKILNLHEKFNPISHIKKFEIIKGDAIIEFPKYLEHNPETVIAFVFFDIDLYAPTKECLNMLKDRLVKGSIIGFDEINDHDCPGETLALMESFGLKNIRLKKHQYTSRVSYFVVE